jgi:sRNA-binding protein
LISPSLWRISKWLCKTYPFLFSAKRHLPLKTGIEKDIFEKEGDQMVFTRSLVRKAIGFYVNHPLYLKNIIEGTLRYDLTGQEAGSIEKRHRENAQEILDSRKKKS